MPIYGLSYHKLAQTSFFQTKAVLSRNDRVVIELEQGQTLAKVNSGPFDRLENVSPDMLPSIIRPAREADLLQEKNNETIVAKARRFWDQCAKKRRLEMKLVDVELFLDRSKFIFYFTAPARVDFRDLVKDLVHEYRVRIELRQIGVRHETQMVGALGNCGMVCCCRRYLHQFAPVTIRMAKEQNLFLNPAKVSGICGRLLCCLANEQESYDAFHRECPRLGKKYQTTRGTMKVLRTNMFCNTVTCVSESNEEIKFSLEEWKALEPKRPDAGSSSSQQHATVVSHVQDELVVVQATPDMVSDPNFLDDVFPPDETGDAVPVWNVDPVMQPGEGESRSRKRKRRSGAQRTSPSTGRQRPSSFIKPQPSERDAGSRQERENTEVRDARNARDGGQGSRSGRPRAPRGAHGQRDGGGQASGQGAGDGGRFRREGRSGQPPRTGGQAQDRGGDSRPDKRPDATAPSGESGV